MTQPRLLGDGVIEHASGGEPELGYDATDAEVIVASWENPDLFSVIFDRHYQRVFGFSVATVGATDGPDLCSEVFVRAFEGRLRYDPARPNARPWLLGIAANLVKGYYRSRGRRLRAYRRAYETSDTPGFEESAVDRLRAEFERPRLAAAMGRLRREEALVVVLYAADLSYLEIANTLDIPVGTVRSRLSRARRRLRNLLADNGEEVDDDE